MHFVKGFLTLGGEGGESGRQRERVEKEEEEERKREQQTHWCISSKMLSCLWDCSVKLHLDN